MNTGKLRKMLRCFENQAQSVYHNKYHDVFMAVLLTFWFEPALLCFMSLYFCWVRKTVDDIEYL